MAFFWPSLMAFGTCTSILTFRSPVPSPFTRGAPLPLMLSTVSSCVPAGTRTRTFVPSGAGTTMLAPSAASATVTGTSTSTSAPLRV